MLALRFGYAGFHVVSRAALAQHGPASARWWIFPVCRAQHHRLAPPCPLRLLPREVRRIHCDESVSAAFELLIGVLVCCCRNLTLSPSWFSSSSSLCVGIVLEDLFQFLWLIDEYGTEIAFSITANRGLYLIGLENTSPTFALRHPEPCSGDQLPRGCPSQARRTLGFRTLKIWFWTSPSHKDSILRDGARVAKMTGTLACVAGATVITPCKGPAIFEAPRTTNSTVRWFRRRQQRRCWGCRTAAASTSSATACRVRGGERSSHLSLLHTWTRCYPIS